MFKKSIFLAVALMFAAVGFMPLHVRAASITISDVLVSNITQISATITWKSSLEGDSQVRYGESLAEVSAANWDVVGTYIEGKTTHTAPLRNLKPDTLYIFDIRTTNANLGDSIKYQGTFSTGTAGVDTITISDVKVSDITTTSATVTWMSNVAGDSQIRYGTSVSSLSDWLVREFYMSGKVSHSATLTGLKPSYLYEFEVRTTNATIGKSVASKGNFTTKGDELPDLVVTDIMGLSPKGDFDKNLAKINQKSLTL